MEIKNLNVLCVFFILCNFIIFEMQANVPRSNLQLSAGWRSDEHKRSFSHLDSEDEITAEEHRNAENVNVWIIGVRGNLSPQFCGCNSWTVNQFYLRGSAYWGWVCNGRWKDSFEEFDPAFETIQDGKTHEGHSRDFDIALGWMFPFCGCDSIFGIGPVGGYSYHYIDFKLDDLCDEADFTDPDANNGSKLTSTFQGPYAGIDVQFGGCCYLISAGYEYHWVNHWKGKFTVPEEPSIGFFSTCDKAKKGHGNVVYLNADWLLCECWEFGLGFKYRYFKSDEGTSVSTDILSVDTVQVQERWKSYEVTLNLGTSF